MKRVLLAVTLIAAAVGWANEKTRVVFYVDTEDYTCDESNDGIRDLAKTLTAEGVRGCFNVVGYLALRIQELGRQDVIDALKPHCLGIQTLYHTRHPTPAEVADDPSYERAYRRALMDEAKATAMVEAVFGEGRSVFTCPPGTSVSASAMEAWYDLGYVFAAGNGYCVLNGPGEQVTRPGPNVDGLWYFNLYQPPYHMSINLDHWIPGKDFLAEGDRKTPDFRKTLDEMAKFDFVGIGSHPNSQIKKVFWDRVNYAHGNLVPWRQWKPAPDRDPADTAQYYRNLAAFVRAIKADGRFRITDFDELKKGVRPRAPITKAELPAIRASLERDFNCIREPASWCVSDVFQAVVRLLRGETSYAPGKVYGFLSRPKGVAVPTEVTAEGLRRAAAKIDLTTFLPPQIDVDGKKIGPADFLFAALEVLTAGTEKVVIAPREQLGSFKEIPSLEKFHLKGVWLHTGDFNDTYTTERFRLQLWTLRIDPVFGRCPGE